MNKGKVCITGGLGFIGSHTVEEALNQGYQVVILDNLSTGKLENIAHLDNVKEIHIGCLTDYDFVQSVIKGCDFVIHLGAKISVAESMNNPMEYNNVNVHGTLNVVRACKKHNIEKLVFASTSAVYSDCNDAHVEDYSVTCPISVYGQTKLHGEEIIKVSEVPYTIFRYFNVFGPKQLLNGGDGAVVPKFLDLYKKGEVFQVYGDGTQIRDFIHVKMVAKANVDSLNNNKSDYEIINLGGSWVSINMLITYFRGAKYEYKPVREGDILISQADTFKYQHIFEIDNNTNYLLLNYIRENK